MRPAHRRLRHRVGSPETAPGPCAFAGACCAIDSRTRALQCALIAADEASCAKSDFLARVSHDLRAPLTAILRYADLIIGSGGRPGEHGRIIRRSAQHLLNLLDNAAKFTRDGHIRLSVQCQDEQPAGDAVAITFVVEDNGPGIAAGELEHIFEPFHRLKATESHEGLGLGLAISKQWVERMGGRIRAESTLWYGTRLSVSLSIKHASEDALSHP